MNMSEELLPCPFCGGDASSDGHTRYSHPLDDAEWEDGSPITEAFFVNCIWCGAVSRGASVAHGYQTKAEAIAAWNARAKSDSQLVSDFATDNNRHSDYDALRARAERLAEAMKTLLPWAWQLERGQQALAGLDLVPGREIVNARAALADWNAEGLR